MIPPRLPPFAPPPQAPAGQLPQAGTVTGSSAAIAHPAKADKREPVNKHDSDSTAPDAEQTPSTNIRRSHPAWLKEVMSRDNTTVRTRSESARIGDSDSSQRWVDDQSGENRPMNKFRSSIYRHLTHRWVHDRSAALDQISSSTYADIRRTELRAIPGAEYLAEQYGLLTAMDATPQQMQHGLRTNNNFSSKYLRDNPHSGLRDQCLSVYRSLGHKHPADKVLFVNSETNALRILKKLKHDDWRIASGLASKAVINVTRMRPGLVAIEFGRSAYVQKAEEILKFLGGRPSSHEVGKLAYIARTPSEPPSRQQEGIDNRKMLSELLNEDSNGIIAALKKLPDEHAMQVTANCAASLLEGLKKAVVGEMGSPQFKNDLLVANALNALINTARALPTLAEDSARFASGYAAMLEELHLLLTSVKPYGETDFKKAAAAMLKARGGQALEKLHIAAPETYLLSSGMEAISMGVDIARKLSGTKSVQPLAHQEKLPDYYETLNLKSKGRLFDEDHIRMATLNPSHPGKDGVGDNVNNWDAEKLVQQTMAWLAKGKMKASKPRVLVLDTTVEKQKPEGKSDLEALLNTLQPYINDGQLKIVLCKSYQKYTLLGSGKIMAGAVTLIARDAPETQAAAARLRRAEEDLGWMNNDDSQLLTHFMTHAHASELEMIGRAAKNAGFISQFCLDALRHSGKFMVRQENELPFVVTDAGNEELIFMKTTPMGHKPRALLGRQVAPRDSFGFLSTSIVTVSDDNLRITAGQETREELVEKLYGFIWINEAGLTQCTPANVLEAAKRIAANAMQIVLRETDVMPWAETALQVLRSRVSRGSGANAAAVDECEALLDKFAGMSTASEAHFGNSLEEQKGMLRQKLATALHVSEPLAENLLTDQLRIVRSAFAPRLTDNALGENDVDVMRTAIRRTHDDSLESSLMSNNEYLMARYAPNAIGSLLAMAGVGFGPEEVADHLRRDLESFYSAVLNAGLPGISPATRAHILLDWSRLQREKIHSTDKETQHAAVNELVRHVRLSPYQEVKAKILASIPDDAFARLDRTMQLQLINALLSPLDVTSRLMVISNLAKDNEFEKLRACIERFGEDLRKSDEGASNMLFPDNLSNAAQLLVDEPRLVTPEKRAVIREDLLLALLHQQREGLGARMASWVPGICNDEKSASQIAKIFRTFETAQNLSDSMSEAQYNALANTLSERVKLLPMAYRQVMKLYIEKIWGSQGREGGRGSERVFLR